MFIPGRSISDNIIIGHCLHALKETKNGRDGFVALKLDMSKAYDRVEWVFVEKVMLKLGFSVDWVDRIMHCISSITFTVNINGVPMGQMIPSRGLRQGTLFPPTFFFYVRKGCQP